MKRILACAAAILLAVSTSSCTVLQAKTSPETSVVKITDGKGHGTGFAYQGRYLITAAHVVGSSKNVKYKGRDGVEHDAEVLWTNDTYDIALLSVKEDLPSARMSCRTAAVGEQVIARGNPMNVEFIETSGRIAGAPREWQVWKSVYVADISAAGGMSGGPVFDAFGEVIGITVGGMVAPMGFGGSFVGLTLLVPSSKICELMARQV